MSSRLPQARSRTGLWHRSLATTLLRKHTSRQVCKTGSTMTDARTQAWAALHQPTTDAQTLAQIAANYPEFAEAIGAHPNAYPELREWATSTLHAARAASAASLVEVSSGATVSAGTGTSPNAFDAEIAAMRAWQDSGIAASQQATAPWAAQTVVTQPGVAPQYAPQTTQQALQTGRRPRTLFWVVAFGVIVLVQFVWSIIFQAIIEAAFAGPDPDRIYSVLTPLSLVIGLYLPNLIIAIAALIAAPSASRKIWGTCIAAVPMLVVGVIDVFEQTGVVYLGIIDALVQLDPYFRLQPGVILLSLCIALGYAVARPLRGYGWIMLPGIAFLPDMVIRCLWPLPLNPWMSIVIVQTTYAVCLLGCVIAAEALRRISERNVAQHQPLQAVGPLAAKPLRTNVLAILALVFSVFGSILGLIFGHVALHQIKRSGEHGRGLAIAGLVFSYVGVWFTLLLGLWVLGNYVITYA